MESSCAEFNLSTTQDGPPTDYRVDYNGEFECFTSGGFTNNSGTHIGNTTVKCNVTWVLSWFPHANMKPIFIRTPVWFENPVPLDQKCENISNTNSNSISFWGSDTPNSR